MRCSDNVAYTTLTKLDVTCFERTQFFSLNVAACHVTGVTLVLHAGFFTVHADNLF